jgi:hypothetical protein
MVLGRISSVTSGGLGRISGVTSGGPTRTRLLLFAAAVVPLLVATQLGLVLQRFRLVVVSGRKLEGNGAIYHAGGGTMTRMGHNTSASTVIAVNTTMGPILTALLPVEPADDSAEDPQQQQDSPKRLPLFILHVGPPKTATTSIQCFLSAHAAELQQDGIHYFGHVVTGRLCGRSYKRPTKRPTNLARPVLFQNCSSYQSKSPPQASACARAFDMFHNQTAVHHRNNETIFMSDEFFSSGHVDAMLLDEFVTQMRHRWRVRVIFTYRRLYQYLPSQYFQQFDLVNTARSRTVLRLWPGDDPGGWLIPTMDDYVGQRLGANKSPSASWQRWTKQQLEFDVTFANMHNNTAGNNFLHHFVCDMVPEAKELCRLLSSSSSSSETTARNSAAPKQQNLHWDQLAVAAYQRGWMMNDNRTTTVSRAAAREALQRHYSGIGMSKLGDFNVTCLSPTNKALLLNLSLIYEYETVPDFFRSEQGESQIRADFAKDGFSEKFCSIDINATLAQRSDQWWREFFLTVR